MLVLVLGLVASVAVSKSVKPMNDGKVAYKAPTCVARQESDSGHAQQVLSTGRGEAHDQNQYRKTRGHAVSDKRYLVKDRPERWSAISVAPLKACGYCEQQFPNAQSAGDHSLNCENGPSVVAWLKAQAKVAVKAKKTPKVVVKVKKTPKGRKAKKA